MAPPEYNQAGNGVWKKDNLESVNGQLLKSLLSNQYLNDICSMNYFRLSYISHKTYTVKLLAELHCMCMGILSKQ